MVSRKCGAINHSNNMATKTRKRHRPKKPTTKTTEYDHSKCEGDCGNPFLHAAVVMYAKVNDKEHRYCSECGTQLKEDICGAEEVPTQLGLDIVYIYDKYNPKTGKRNFGRRYYCPVGAARWFGRGHHDDYKEYDKNEA